MRGRHHMPFGAEVRPEGVRFRLWAPAAEHVQLVLQTAHGPQRLPMPAVGDGWYELVTAAARTGDRYRFRIDDKVEITDPATRASDDVHGPGLVVDPDAYAWQDDTWSGIAWHEAVIYELHVGSFTPEGTFAAVESRLDHLQSLGVTLIEFMPIGQFPGKWGWGYDGVLPFAPYAGYGTPNDLKRLVDAVHRRGLGVILDVVYNHFGPEGNWLHAYAPQFFTDRHRTPWGQAINFDGAGSRVVRDYFIHNALYWLEEFHFDGLRVDAVHAMLDGSAPHFVAELVRRVREGPGRQRPIHIVLENHANEAHRLGAPGSTESADAQWNDDLHHSVHAILTGETDGYYTDYTDDPHALLCRSLAEGFAYQGEMSRHSGGHPRGEPSAGLPPTAFVSFLQTHDQIGNRAQGERLSELVHDEAALRAAASIVLLAPSPPMLFMGEEWAASTPFLYFCDFEPDLAQRVRDGRRREFARFARFDAASELPDPAARTTFEGSRLDWSQLRRRRHARWLSLHRRLLAVRRRDVVPLIPDIKGGRCSSGVDRASFAVEWNVGDRATLRLLANLSTSAAPSAGRLTGRVLAATHPGIRDRRARGTLEPWCVILLLERRHAGRT